MRSFATSRRSFLAGLTATAALAGCRSTPLSVDGLGLSNLAVEAAHHYPMHGIDVAKYQGDVDWDAARDGGVAFAWLKSTEGGDRLDERFKANWRGAGAARLPRGAYHFWYHCRPGDEQAAWFIQNVPKQTGSLPPVIDIEWTPFSPTCTIRPPRDVLVREVGAMSRILEQHYGQRPILYVPIDVHRDRLVGAFPDHEFWVRAVKDHPDDVYEGRKFRFWQYTATGTVPGVQGEVDRNAFAGTRRDWITWLRAHLVA
ncbi:glycoside hydrolase family 25 protein [Jiella sp. MQZ9-1]|uniref:glycoside hydrolase family 25 protein n=1 Tax=Jiella flava TaxID=2816857 RepID=UPI001E2DAAB4|nr:glycoside hydrolase family 25 protein [Jiella flava]